MFRVDILDENLSKSTLSYWEIRYDFTAKVILEAIFTLSRTGYDLGNHTASRTSFID